MTEEAKILLGELRTEGCKRCIHMKIGCCAHIQQGKTCGTLYHQAADMIEFLLKEFGNVVQERDGLNILLTQARSMLETRTRERDAAVEDLRGHCFRCVHNEPGKLLRESAVCLACIHNMDDEDLEDNWQWRGVKEADDEQ